MIVQLLDSFIESENRELTLNFSFEAFQVAWVLEKLEEIASVLQRRFA